MSLRRGQVWSYDLMISVVAFMLVLAFLIFFWWSVSTAIGMPRGERMTEEALDMADILMSPGNPSNWNDTVNSSLTSTWGTIALLGVGESFGSPRLSQSKLEKLLAMNSTNYTELRLKFKTNYQFYVEMKEFYNCSAAAMLCALRGIPVNSSEYQRLDHFVPISGQNFTIGIYPPSGSARSIVAVNRFGVYNSSLVRIRVVLWTNQTWQ